MFAIALDLLKEIHKIGYVAYIVGGYPRDKYRGGYTEDIDICTNMQYEEIQKNFDVRTAYPKMGSFTILYKNTLFEITTFRKEGTYLDYRHPSTIVFVDTLEEDLLRRDFVMNTLCIDKNGEYVDLLGAREDIEQKKIQVVGEVTQKLKEDPLRMVRAIRFMVALDFTLEETLKRTIENNLVLLKKIPKGKIKEEIGKISSKEKQEVVRGILKI